MLSGVGRLRRALGLGTTRHLHRLVERRVAHLDRTDRVLARTHDLDALERTSDRGEARAAHGERGARRHDLEVILQADLVDLEVCATAAHRGDRPEHVAFLLDGGDREVGARVHQHSRVAEAKRHARAHAGPDLGTGREVIVDGCVLPLSVRGRAPAGLARHVDDARLKLGCRCRRHGICRSRRCSHRIRR